MLFFIYIGIISGGICQIVCYPVAARCTSQAYCITYSLFCLVPAEDAPEGRLLLSGHQKPWKDTKKGKKKKKNHPRPIGRFSVLYLLNCQFIFFSQKHQSRLCLNHLTKLFLFILLPELLLAIQHKLWACPVLWKLNTGSNSQTWMRHCGSMNSWVLEVKENEAERLSDSTSLEDAVFGFVTHLKCCVMKRD